MIDLGQYDRIVVAFSGGKDSVACVLHLLERGVDSGRVELWHHEIDGREGSALMDWPCTPAYCQAFAGALKLPVFFSWKVGGFERELLRENQRTAPTRFEMPGGVVEQVGGTRGKRSTRRKFPQVSANLSVRWCSAYLKIDVMAAAIRNQERFRNQRTLVVTGERAQESTARSRYACFEAHRADARNSERLGRHIDHWRPIHAWKEERVWGIMRRWRINPHPCYHLGYSRCSCMKCIFGNDDQWASCHAIDPSGTRRIIDLEEGFGHTIHRTLTVRERIERGTPYAAISPEMVEIALSRDYNEPIIVENWKLPAGAFGESAGPT